MFNEFNGKITIFIPILIMTSDFEDMEGIKTKKQGGAYTETIGGYLQIL